MRILRDIKGASFVETALAFPIAILGIFGFTYFSISLIALGILDHAANRAMRSITTHPAFDKPPASECESSYDCNEEGEWEFCQALYCLKESSKNIPLGTFFGLGEASATLVYLEDSPDNPDITMPAADVMGDQSYHDALQNQPVVVTYTARIRSPFPYFKDIAITSKATGYIEIRTKPNLPVKIDCNGYREGHELYMKTACDCSSHGNSVYNLITHQCEACKFDRLAPPKDGSIPEGFYQVAQPADGTFRNAAACLCPTHEFCRTKYGPGSHSAPPIMNRPDNNMCRCACSYLHGFVSESQMDWNTTPGTGCECAPLAPLADGGTVYKYPSDDVRANIAAAQGVAAEAIGQVDLKPSRIIVMTGDGMQKCKCQKLAGGMMGSTECRNIFANTPLANRVQISSDQCACGCKQCPSSDFAQDQGIVSWNLTSPDACKCACPANKTYNITTNECICNNKADETNGNCPLPAKLNNQCQCECPNKDCGFGITKSPAQGCVCQGCPYGLTAQGLCAENPSEVGG